MKQKKLIWMLAAILTICGPLFTSCSVEEDNPVPVIEPEPSLPPAEIVDSMMVEHIKTYVFHYPSQDPFGRPTTQSGTITFNPLKLEGDRPMQGILLYNHYTVNHRDECPSHGFLGEQYIAAANYHFFIVSADYHGFGTTESEPQAYCIARANAQTSVDALLAARELLKQKGYQYGDELVQAGYSQGGQTTIGVLRLVAERYPDLHFRRSFAGGGPYDITAIYRKFAESHQTSMPSTVANVLYAYNYYGQLGFAMSDMFKSPLAETFQELILSKEKSQKELDELLSHDVTEWGTPAVLDLTSPMGQAFLAAFAADNLASGWTPRAGEDIVIYHNTQDDAVPVEAARQLVEFLTAKGVKVENLIDDYGGGNILTGGPHESAGFDFFLRVFMGWMSKTYN